MQVGQPDEIVSHRPAACTHCQQPLEAVAGRVKERRQVYDLPAVRVVVQEHQVEEVWCPACQSRNEGSFPSGVEAPVQYGPNVRALGVYLHQYQLVPLARSGEWLEDLYNCHISQATLLSWVQQAEIGDTQFCQVALRTQTCHRQGRVDPAGNHDVQVWWQMIQQKYERVVDRWHFDQMVVIEDEGDL